MRGLYRVDNENIYTGAFILGDSGSVRYGGSDGINSDCRVFFSAQVDNSIYGLYETVQTPSAQVLIIIKV